MRREVKRSVRREVKREGRGKGGEGGRLKVTQSSFVGKAGTWGDHVKVLTPKLLCSRLLLRAAVL